jgi:hypothetical protein
MSYSIVLGSLGPVFPITLTENDVAFPLDVINDTVILRYLDASGNVHEVDMDITLAASGECEYIWTAGDLPVAGPYKGQVKVSRAGDATFPRTFPSDGSHIIWWVHTAI